MKTIFKKNTSQTVPRATVKAHASFQGQKVVASLTVAALVSGSARALTFDELQGLTYLQVKGSGLANTCPVLEGGSTNLRDLPAGDYAFTTVQLPGGERVPFLFTVKQLNANGSLDNFGGEFNVPSYRGSSFLDPKGRGGSTGYDTAVALPARGDDEELAKENTKNTAALKGSIVLSAAKVDPTTGEVAGLFQSIQPSDTDLGAKPPKDVKVTGLWYARLSKA